MGIFLLIIQGRISNQILYKVWDEITCAFLHFNSAAIEVLEWVNIFIPRFIGPVINRFTRLKLVRVSKGLLIVSGLLFDSTTVALLNIMSPLQQDSFWIKKITRHSYHTSLTWAEESLHIIKGARVDIKLPIFNVNTMSTGIPIDLSEKWSNWYIPIRILWLHDLMAVYQ